MGLPRVTSSNRSGVRIDPERPPFEIASAVNKVFIIFSFPFFRAKDVASWSTRLVSSSGYNLSWRKLSDIRAFEGAEAQEEEGGREVHGVIASVKLNHARDEGESGRRPYGEAVACDQEVSPG